MAIRRGGWARRARYDRFHVVRPVTAKRGRM
nr:MAG TPA: hypothetical protein [Caudoviricetes sp.]